MRCVFCLSPDPPNGFSDEHVFPEAVGGTLVVRFVCKDCNSRLGHSVDTTVTNHKLIGITRKALGIAGKSGPVPNPLERAVMEADPSHKVRFDFTKRSPESIYTIPFVQRTQTGPGRGNLSVRIDATDADKLGDIVNKALVRAGAPPISAETIGELKKNVVRQDQPRLSIPVSLDLSQYRRGLMKIVYELACYWIGESYVDDPLARQLRQFTFDEGLPFDPSQRYPIRGTMRMSPKAPFMPFWPDERDHLRGVLLNRGDLGIYVSVLGVLDACVAITDSPEKYADCEQRFISIDPRTGLMRESTFEKEAGRICHLGNGNETDEAGQHAVAALNGKAFDGRRPGLVEEKHDEHPATRRDRRRQR